MIKNKLMLGAVLGGAMLSASVFASSNANSSSIGVVNMQKILQTAPQVKQINDQLRDQFSKRKADILSQAKVLQADMADYNKNKTVMSAAKLKNLENKIGSEENQLRMEQMSYQQDLMTAQNKAMNNFLTSLKSAVTKVATSKKLTLVLPENTLLYAAPGADVTAAVLDNLKG